MLAYVHAGTWMEEIVGLQETRCIFHLRRPPTARTQHSDWLIAVRFSNRKIFTMELNKIFIAEPLDKLKIATFFEQKRNKNRLFLLLLEGKDILAIIST